MSQFEAKVILDSVSPGGKRLTTVSLTYPRFIHSEIMTHRDRARNAASSRAIPWSKMKNAIMASPVIPLVFGSEKKGMQTGSEIDRPDLAQEIWSRARDNAVASADHLANLGVHKSICNRLTEPFMWITVIMTATEWNNFFRIRCHPDAEIHFQKIATLARDVLGASTPKLVEYGSWHLPYITQEELAQYNIELLKRASTARCARVSYLNHEGVCDIMSDQALFERLVTGSGFGHWSAHEHIATPNPTGIGAPSGPYRGWIQFRKQFALENAEG